MKKYISRRSFLISTIGGTSLCTNSFLTGVTLAQEYNGKSISSTRFSKRTIPFGSAIRGRHLGKEKDYSSAILTYCDQIVDEGNMKWIEIQPAPGKFSFGKADLAINFSKKHRLVMRGHTLVWYAAIPDWVKQLKSPIETEKEIKVHIETVVGRYRDVIPSWDVVNEPIADHPSHRNFLRPSVWQAALGERYIDMAFKTAHDIAPKAQLVLNENNLAVKGELYTLRRKKFIELLSRLLERGVPIHAIGIQGHLRGDWRLDRDSFQKLLSDIKSMGLKILVTEMDVIDHTLPATSRERDIAVAARAYEFLETLFEVSHPEAILTWGISDRYTWVPVWFKRKDGLPNRPLPLDQNMKEKPLMNVINHFTHL